MSILWVSMTVWMCQCCVIARQENMRKKANFEKS